MTATWMALRARYLLVMGIPGAALLATVSCGSSGGQPGHGGPPPEPTPPSTPVDEAGLCPGDWVRSSTCGYAPGTARPGATPAEDCPPSNATMTDRYLVRGEYYDSRPSQLDTKLTAQWRSLGPPMPKPQPFCCYSKCAPLEVHAEPNLVQHPGTTPMPECIGRPDAASSEPSEADPRCPAAVRLGMLPTGSAARFVGAHESDEPADKRPELWRVGMCCYEYYGSREGVGRALRVDGQRRVAGEREGDGWDRPDAQAPLPVCEHDRVRLSQHWRTVAALEHASVAAFARLSLQLMALGAPAELLQSTHEAALDEVEHARIAYGLASAYAGTRVAPAPLDVGGESGPSLQRLAAETLLDGCLEETVGSVWAARAADAATDPCVAGALRRIAEDEARHAELAWRILAWALRVDPGLGAALAAALATTRDARATSFADEAELEHHGVLGARSTAAIRAAVEREVVVPCLEALIDSARAA